MLVFFDRPESSSDGGRGGKDVSGAIGADADRRRRRRRTGALPPKARQGKAFGMETHDIFGQKIWTGQVVHRTRELAVALSFLFPWEAVEGNIRVRIGNRITTNWRFEGG